MGLDVYLINKKYMKSCCIIEIFDSLWRIRQGIPFIVQTLSPTFTPLKVSLEEVPVCGQRYHLVSIGIGTNLRQILLQEHNTFMLMKDSMDWSIGIKFRCVQKRGEDT